MAMARIADERRGTIPVSRGKKDQPSADQPSAIGQQPFQVSRQPTADLLNADSSDFMRTMNNSGQASGP